MRHTSYITPSPAVACPYCNAKLVRGSQHCVECGADISKSTSLWFWHKKNDKEPRGPVDDAILDEMARTGELRRHDKVWKEGLKDWVSAFTVPDLFSVPPPITNDPAPKPVADGEPDGQFSVEEENGVHGSEPDVRSPIHVGGWLLFFCVALTILGPLASLYIMMTSWEEAQPAFDMYPALEAVVVLENLVIAVILFYGFFTGVEIWRGNEKGKTLAERYLRIRLSTFVVAELLVLVLVSDLPGSVLEAMWAAVSVALFREALVFGIWYSYFKKSKRVAVTYGTTTSSKVVSVTDAAKTGELPQFVICPNCAVEVELDEGEREQMKYRCPECGETVDALVDTRFSEPS